MYSSIQQSHFCVFLIISPFGVLRYPNIVVRRSRQTLHMVLSEFQGSDFYHFYWPGIPTYSMVFIVPLQILFLSPVSISVRDCIDLQNMSQSE